MAWKANIGLQCDTWGKSFLFSLSNNVKFTNQTA